MHVTSTPSERRMFRAHENRALIQFFACQDVISIRGDCDLRAAKFRDDLMKLVGPESWKNISNLIEKNKSNNFGLHFLVCAPGPKAVRKFSPTFPDSVSSVVVVANEKDSWNHSEINR
jgi:hypothetical protein